MASVGRSRASTPSFTATFRLNVDRHQARVLDKRFDAARRLYNAVLGECLRRARRMRESRLWTRARSAPSRDRSILFQQARTTYGLRLYDLFPYAGEFCRAEIGNHLDVTTARGICKRAYDAVNDWILGKRGRPRFKSWQRGLRSLGGLQHQGILLRAVPPVAGADPLSGYEVRWKGLRMPLRFRHGKHPCRHGDAHRRVIAHALACPVKFVRLLRKVHGAQTRHYAQVVFSGTALARVTPGDEVVGWDVGTSTSAWVAETAADLAPFAPGLADHRRLLRRLQRRVDRQRRAGNPDNFRADGTVRPGRKVWRVSRRQATTEGRVADLLRRHAEQRRNENGQLANRIVRQGRHVRTEDVRVGAWTRVFGRQIGRSAPAAVVAAVRRKAESAGGQVLTLPLRLALSQTCPCGYREKKPLSQRVHHCARCGLTMQRDLLSAYLARYADATVLQVGQALDDWPAAEPLLLAAWRTHPSASAPRAETPAGATASCGRSGSQARRRSRAPVRRDVVAAV